MARTLLFIVLVIAFAAGISYRLMQDKRAEAMDPAPMNEAAPAPVVAPVVSPTPAAAAPTDNDEDAPKLASPDAEKFESEDDAEDSADGVTIEVEEEE